jgi:quinoprotein glucose dehydrogenase
MSAVLRRTLLGAPFLAYLMARTPLARAAAAPPDTEWPTYGGNLASQRYAPLDQINASNFNDLEVAWRFKPDAFGPRPEFNLQSTPLVAKGVMYTTVGTRRDVVALDAATGELLWMHRMEEGERADRAPRKLSGRGLSYWTDGTDQRIFYVTIGYRLVALDARTGARIAGFGEGGVVDLKLQDDQEIDPLNGDVGLHATPLVTRDVVIVGAAHTVGSVPKIHKNVIGYVRAFDVRTGQRKWIFHTIPKKGEFGYDSWEPGDAELSGNTGVWAQMSADEDLGLAYLPVELPTGDSNGHFRRGNALFGESVVAVDIETGQRRWHYQTVHHGLWDYDIPCAPILADVPMNGKTVKVLAQPTKQSWLYVLDRETGKPIWPIPEKKVAKGDVPGEWYAATQPFPSKPPAFDRQGVTENDLIDFTPALKAEGIALARNYTLGPMFTPPTVWGKDGKWGTLIAPNVTGGTNWPGGCYDPESHILYIYSKTEADVVSSVPNTTPERTDFDYVSSRGNPPPGQKPEPRGGFRPGVLQVQGLPLLKPPYGRITAIDLTRGEIVWQIAHGETPDEIRNHPALKGLTIPRTGRAGLVGTLATKSLIIAGEAGFFTAPNGRRGAMLRAYDKATGQEKGAVYMPAPQTGSPMTYMLGGRQYIVLAIGGGSYSAELVAFRLPKA